MGHKSIAASPPPAGSDEAVPLSRHISYSFSVKNTLAETIPQAEFWTYAPYPLSVCQRRTKLSASYPFKLLRDENANQILYFSFSDFPPYGTKIIRIEAELRLAEHLHPEHSEPLNSGISDPEIRQFLESERFCEVDEPSIIELARELRGESTLKSAENIFRWVSTNIRYSGYFAQPRGAKYALERRQGDCTEFMFLFMALCRAAGIPARGLGGYVVEKNAVLTPSAYHNWAEFYAAGAWRLADPQRKIFMQNQSDYLIMRILGPVSETHPMRQHRHFRYEGKGLEVRMN